MALNFAPPRRDLTRLNRAADLRVYGHYSFALPDLGGDRRPLRDPDVPAEE